MFCKSSLQYYYATLNMIVANTGTRDSQTAIFGGQDDSELVLSSGMHIELFVRCLEVIKNYHFFSILQATYHFYCLISDMVQVFALFSHSL